MSLSKRDFPQILKAIFNEQEQALAVTGTLVPGGAAIPVDVLNSLVPTAYDEIDLSYTGQNLTGVVYKFQGTTVATLALTYSGSNLTNVVKS